MNEKGKACLVFAVLVLFLVLAWYSNYQATKRLSSEQREEMRELTVELNSLRVGDLVTMQFPKPETYIVKQLTPPNSAILSGPGPMSRQEKNRFLNWGPPLAVRDFVDAGLATHRRGDPGWEELATWYYLQ
ncbi:hypothetical protein KJ969_01295 [Patescibacteria group bacterium]|nr:hypothetical protein [Patescibacteria group bacterium]MBU1922293.1 hypothetical protein [Patescibacteria group bacterium]